MGEAFKGQGKHIKTVLAWAFPMEFQLEEHLKNVANVCPKVVSILFSPTVYVFQIWKFEVHFLASDLFPLHSPFFRPNCAVVKWKKSTFPLTFPLLLFSPLCCFVCVVSCVCAEAWTDFCWQRDHIKGKWRRKKKYRKRERGDLILFSSC